MLGKRNRRTVYRDGRHTQLRPEHINRLSAVQYNAPEQLGEYKEIPTTRTWTGIVWNIPYLIILAYDECSIVANHIICHPESFEKPKNERNYCVRAEQHQTTKEYRRPYTRESQL